MGDLPIGGLPDLRARALKMRAGIVRVRKLVQHLALPGLFHSRRQITRALHALGTGDMHDLRAESAHGGRPLCAGILRHDQDHAVTAHGRDHGQGNTGITAGGFDQGIAGLNLATRLGVAQHAVGRAVLHGACGIVAFQLGENLIAPMSQVAIQALNTNQRGVADGGVERGNCHGGGFYRMRSTGSPPIPLRSVATAADRSY